MPDLGIKTLDGNQTTLASDSVDSFRAGLRGSLCLPGEPGYDEARTIWNGMYHRQPAVIVRAAGVADVIQTVKLAREHRLLLAVRAGGHSVAGKSVCDGGLLLDLSLMKSVRVDPRAKTARVEPGVTLAGLDHETQAFGLATPLGINSTTGVAGLTLGGGFGWVSRKYGLTVDNLREVDIVTADGELLTANSKKNPDLFWAVRGGGGNFGVVTSFEFKLHRIGPQILSGLIVHPVSAAPELLPAYRKYLQSVPDEVSAWIVIRNAPPLPFLPAAHHGKPIMIFGVCAVGSMKKAKQAVAPLRKLGAPIADVIGPHPYAGWQQAFDPLLAPGARNYWKSHDFRALDDGLFAAVIDAANRLPSPHTEIVLIHLGAAINRVAGDATAYPHRDAEFIMNLHTRWEDPADDDKCIGWARGLFDAAQPFSTGGVYVNFMPEDETQRVQKGAFARNYEKLAMLKAKYDPGNLFRLNQNIEPAK